MKGSLKTILENEGSDKPIKVGQFRKIGKLSLTSADDQIDAYLTNIQLDAVEAKKKEEENDAESKDLSESLTSFNLKALLKEEEGVLDSSKIDIKDPVESENVAINVTTFAKHLKEFVQLAHERLDIPSVIVNRARNFIKEKHPDAVGAFDEALRDVQLGGEKRFETNPDDSFQAGAIGGGG